MTNKKMLQKTIEKKLRDEEPLSKDEVCFLFKNEPEVIALFEQADFIMELAKEWL